LEEGKKGGKEGGRKEITEFGEENNDPSMLGQTRRE